ncbi:MAG: hypothetical protein A4S09_03025 [Proteobacteria bacterium SG_bin7]|nr:MAG: hypothetical protein A4S09_03025 [Proteobacteria bacterium SG_bin7]
MYIIFFTNQVFAENQSLKGVWPDVLTSIVAVHKPGASLLEPQLNGTGFIVENSDEGVFILTNYHVIQSSLNNNQLTKKNPHMMIEFLRKDLDMQAGYIEGYSQVADIALLRVNLSELGQQERLKTLKVLSFGNSEALTFGEDLLAIGHPLANKKTPTFPRFTGQGFFVEDKVSVIRINGDLGPGNSGGPLFNMRGEVIGVNTSILPAPAQGVGYAVPSNVIRNFILPQLRKAGKPPADRVKYASLGISLQPLDGALMRFLKLDTRSGGIVTHTPKDSPGFGSGLGLQRGDIVVGVNGQSYDDNPLRGISGLTLFNDGVYIVYDIIPNNLIRDGRANGPESIWRLSFFPEYKTLKEIQNEISLPQQQTPNLLEKSADLLGFYLTDAQEGVFINRDLKSNNKRARQFIREIAFYSKDFQNIQFQKIDSIDDIERVLLKSKTKEVLLILSKDFNYDQFSKVEYFLTKVP